MLSLLEAMETEEKDTEKEEEEVERKMAF